MPMQRLHLRQPSHHNTFLLLHIKNWRSSQNKLERWNTLVIFKTFAYQITFSIVRIYFSMLNNVETIMKTLKWTIFFMYHTSIGQTRPLESKYGGINNLILVGEAMTIYVHGINLLIHLVHFWLQRYHYSWKMIHPWWWDFCLNW